MYWSTIQVDNSTHWKWRTTMKRLVLLGAALGLLATPAHAQAQKKFDSPVYVFNGNIFDAPSAPNAAAPKAAAPKSSAAPKMAQAKGPAKKAPLVFNGNVFD
jgi:hypothetical protein